MAKISKNAKKLLALTLAGVMTVGTAVPGTAMSTVQEVKAENTDFNPETYMTSADWMNKFDEIFHTLFVGADKQIVADNQYIIPLAKGDELPQDPEAVKAAILGQLTEEELTCIEIIQCFLVSFLNNSVNGFQNIVSIFILIRCCHSRKLISCSQLF